jgi:hypothetical protein
MFGLEITVVKWCVSFSNSIQMHGEFRRVEGLALAKVFTRSDNFIPRLRFHAYSVLKNLKRTHVRAGFHSGGRFASRAAVTSAL